MATIVHKYSLSYVSTTRSVTAAINCFDENKQVGTILFVRKGQTIPENSERDGRISLFFEESHFANVVDILRNEKPVYLSLHPTLKIGGVGTDKEPVGEMEPV